MKFALITEGPSEHRIIKHIIAKYFKGMDPEFNQIQPKLVHEKQVSIGGWNEVLKYCERKEISDILIENDYLVIQIDTDQSQTSPFNIDHLGSDGHMKTSEQLHADVIQKLQSLILPEILEKNGNNILFAVCIHTIECWLLPLCYTDNHRSKTTNCLVTLNAALRRQNKLTIPTESKNSSIGMKAYDSVLQNLSRKADIIANAQYNFGFNSFVQSLNDIV
jgi:hypothetical protein